MAAAAMAVLAVAVLAVNGGSSNGERRQQQWQLMAVVAMGLFPPPSTTTTTGWHWQQWLLQPMVAVAMAVIVINCALVVDAAATILSLLWRVAAKTPLPLLPSTVAAVNDYCHR